MSDDTDANIQLQLKAIQTAQKDLAAKFDRLLIGVDGNDGVIPRMARLESRQNSLAGVFALLCTSLTALACFVLPMWFRPR